MTFIKFLGVGGIATSVQYLLLLFFVEFGLFSAAVASAVGYVCASVVNYLLNYYLTFRSDAKHHVAGLKFIVVVFVGLILNTTLMYLFVNILEIYYVISQLIATLNVLLWNFFANKNWTYKVITDEEREH